MDKELNMFRRLVRERAFVNLSTLESKNWVYED